MSVALPLFSPVIATGPETAGSATLVIAAVTSASVVIGLERGERQRDRGPRRPVAVQRGGGGLDVELLPLGSGLTGWGVTPSKRMLPSTAGLSNAGFSSVSAAFSAAGSERVTTPTSRVVNSDVIRVTGLSGWAPARATVAGQSTDRPAVRGSTVVLASPIVTGTGCVVRGSIWARRVCSALARGTPPTGTPTTVTPRGIEPEENSRSPP